MRKGDVKRQELLDAAEKLFCSRGYEGASVQDILQATGISKGGFYHHFASKEEVMKALCARRAERAVEVASAALQGADTPMARINAVLHAFMPLRRDAAEFVAMLLPIIAQPEGRAVAMTYQDALAEAFLPMLKAEIASAAVAEAVFRPTKDMEDVVLHMVNHCWMQAAAVLIAADRANQRCDQLTLLGLLTKYRRAVEVLLDAPYGSIEIIRVEEWDEVAGLILRAMRGQ